MPPNSVVKWVESISTMSPARWPVGGIQISALNSVLPASVNGCGRFGSTRCRPSTRRSVAFRRGELVVRQVRVEVERGDVVEQPQGVEVADGGQRRDLLGAFDDGGSQTPRVVHGHVERLHQRAGVLAEALLARHEAVAVVFVLHLALAVVVGEADIVMGRQQQTGALSFEPFE